MNEIKNNNDINEDVYTPSLNIDKISAELDHNYSVLANIFGIIC